MIDTNELRKIANKTDWHGSKIYCSSIALWMEDVANELDRLYEIERRNIDGRIDSTKAIDIQNELFELREHKRRNTPLTREEIEAELVRRGFVKFHSDNDETVYRRGGDRFYVFHGDARQYYQCVAYQSILLSAVTLQLLDAVLEAK